MSNRYRVGVAISFVLLAFSLSASSAVAAETGYVRGEVVDQTGQSLSGAEVRLTNSSSGNVVQTTTSNSDGTYSFTELEPGRYVAKAELEGYQSGQTEVLITRGAAVGYIVLGEQEDPAHFEVSIDGTNSPVTEGDTPTIDATVTNTGDQEGTAYITGEIPGVGSDSTAVNLSSGSSMSVTFSIPTSTGDAGTYTATVSTDDNTDSTSVTIEGQDEPANFDVDIDSTNSPVTEGDTLTVDATIQNTGDKSGSQTVTAEVPGVGSDSKTVSLNGGSSTFETFSIPTSSGDGGSYTAAISTDDDSTSTSITIKEQEEPANFDVSIDRTNSPVEVGSDLTVDTTITNTGDQRDTQSVTVEVPGVGTDSETVTLNGGSSNFETLSIPTSDGDAGSYTATVSTNDDTDSANVAVEEGEEPANFEVNLDNTNSPVQAGEALTVETTITNTGDQDGSQTVTAEVPDVGSDSATVSLNGGSSTTESLQIPTNSGENGSYSVSVSADDNTDSTEVTVSERQSNEDDGNESATVGSNTGDRTDTEESDRNNTTSGDNQGGSSPTSEETGDSREQTNINWLVYALGLVGLVGGGYGGYRVISSDDEDGDTGAEIEEKQKYNSPGNGNATGPRTIGGDGLAGSLSYESLEKTEPIGGGGNADVYKAIADTDDGEFTVALKEPRMSGTLHIEKADRIMQEAETWSELDDHENIVSVVDYGSEPLPWIAMEYMDGGHMGEVVGKLDTEQALWTAVSVTEGVGYAHQKGIAHLDLKPENILFKSAENGHDIPKVADWGLSKHLLEHSKSIEGMSPQYAAPEQFDDDYGAADNITDVYQLGAVFYDLFTGRPPFEGKPTKVMRAVMDEEPKPPSEIADVPEGLDEILMKALSKNKKDRYDNIVYLRDDLQSLYKRT